MWEPSLATAALGWPWFCTVIPSPCHSFPTNCANPLSSNKFAYPSNPFQLESSMDIIHSDLIENLPWTAPALTVLNTVIPQNAPVAGFADFSQPHTSVPNMCWIFFPVDNHRMRSDCCRFWLVVSVYPMRVHCQTPHYEFWEFCGQKEFVLP